MLEVRMQSRYLLPVLPMNSRHLTVLTLNLKTENSSRL